MFQGAVRFNTYVGVAGAAALHGSLGATTAAVAVALMVPVVNVMCVASFVAAGTLGRASLGKSALALAKNPLILACLAGIGLNLSGVGLPGWSEDTVTLLGRAALPLGLVAVGVALKPMALLRIDRGVIATNAIKLLCMPACVLLGRRAAVCCATHGHLGIHPCPPAGRRCGINGGHYHRANTACHADAAVLAQAGRVKK